MTSKALRLQFSACERLRRLTANSVETMDRGPDAATNDQLLSRTLQVPDSAPDVPGAERAV